jgi:hypothetical protein
MRWPVLVISPNAPVSAVTANRFLGAPLYEQRIRAAASGAKTAAIRRRPATVAPVDTGARRTLLFVALLAQTTPPFEIAAAAIDAHLGRAWQPKPLPAQPAAP